MKFELEIWGLKLKFAVEIEVKVWSWGLNLKCEVETEVVLWSWSWIEVLSGSLKFEVDV